MKRPLLVLLVLSLLASTMIPALADSGKVYRLAGDFNGDGITTPGWFTDGTFVLYGATAGGDTVRFRYGRPGDVPVVGDWEGDGRDTVGVVRNGRRWLLRDSNTSGDADRTFVYGGWLGRDRPVVGDWTGKGYDAPGVVRGSTWHLRTTLSSGNADITFTYGRVGRGDIPVVGDWTKKGRDTAGVVRGGVWHLRDTNRGGNADWIVKYGRSSDVPVVGNWDGRGGDTPGVVRGTTWMLKNTLSGGSADVTVDLADAAVNDTLTEPEIVATKRPTTKTKPVSPGKPLSEPESEPESNPEPAPSTDETASSEPTPIPPSDSQVAVEGGTRVLYASADITRFQSMMAGGSGPFFSRGDAGHGGQYSPGDGQRSLEHARAFLSDPRRSYWKQAGLPFSAGDPAPLSFVYAYPMHAAWVYMTVPDHADRDALGREVKQLLLAHATDPTLDFSNSNNYPVNYPGYAANPIFEQAQWISRLFKARDMLGPAMFTDEENATLDQWMHGYANWSAKWLQHEVLGKQLPGRLSRDYSTVRRAESASRASYDGGPLIGDMAMTYNNRIATVASTMSLAANYLATSGYRGQTLSSPAYGTYSVGELLEHSRLFVEETLRFSVYPQGVQGDFERGDARYHGGTAQLGWLYSINVLASLVDMADYHARRGDMSVWEYGTTAGYDGTAGKPIAGGFERKSLHFFAWSMSRYMNDGWKRTNRGEPIVLSHFFHDVIPAAVVARYYPDDALLQAAWKREGSGFPAYGQSPQSQGPWHAHYGEGAKQIGLIEHAY